MLKRVASFGQQVILSLPETTNVVSQDSVTIPSLSRLKGSRSTRAVQTVQLWMNPLSFCRVSKRDSTRKTPTAGSRKQ
eukprot:444871-Amphidinium_carterae.1